MVRVRVRLRFESTPLEYSRQCWFSFDPATCRLVGDLAFLIADRFDLEKDEAIQLFMDGFLIPSNESVELVRDNDTIDVRTVELKTSSSSPELPSRKRMRIEDPKREEKRRKRVPGNKVTPTSNAQLEHEAPPTGSSKISTLHAVTKQTSSGRLHTKFYGSSSSSPEPNEISTTPTAKTLPFKQNRTMKETQTKNPRAAPVAKPLNRASITYGNRSLPAVVGGPSDKLTTKSLVFRKASSSSPSSSSSSSSSSSESSGNELNIEASRNKDRGKVTLALENVKAVQKNHQPLLVERDQPPSGKKENTVSAVSHSSHGSSNGKGKVGETPGTNQGQKAGTRGSNGTPCDSKMEDGCGESQGRIKDYSDMPSLLGPPRVGDKIAFKIIELTSSYTPEPSEYKEAEVTGYEPKTRQIKLKYSEDTRKREKKKALTTLQGKFSLPMEGSREEEEEEEEEEGEEEVNFGSLLEAKLITQT